MDKFTVRGVDGSVDVDSSVAAYTQALTEWVSRNEVSVAKIEQAVHAVFDSNSSAIPTTMLVHTVALSLTSDPAMFASVSKQVHSYVKSQTALGTHFTVVRGHNGGIVRLQNK
jgi:hypothetical protein